jgi:hypothetical protein
VSFHARGRSRLAWLDRFIVPRETPLAPSRWHQHIVQRRVSRLLVIFGASGAGRLLGILLYVGLAVRPILGARGSRPALSPAGAA